MADTKQPQGWTDGLKKILSQLATLATEPDADVSFAAQLQGTIVQYIKSQMPGAPQPGGQQPGQGGPPGAGGPPGPPPGTMTGGAMPGLNPGQPASDELQRIMGG